MNIKKIFAVAGNPILHSKSPLLFNLIFNNLENDFHYSRILSESPEEIIDLAKKLNLSGLNITSPFKESIIPYLNELDETAQKIKSVNTIKNDNGKLIGFNTDWFGCLMSLKNKGFDFNQKKCLIVGVGGAARAAIQALKRKNAQIIIVNRTLENAKKLAEEFNCKFIDISAIAQVLQESDVLISTLNYFEPEIFLNNINPNAFIVDAIYHNSKLKNSLIQQEFNHLKDKYISGEEWLYYQGIESLKHFLGIDYDNEINKMNLYSEKLFFNKNNIILSGFMGSGKTSIGKILASKLNFEFIDTDDLIETSENTSISEIFENNGEDYFRNLEFNIIKNISSKKRCVISLGGGTLTNLASANLIKKMGIRIFLYSDLDICLSRINQAKKPMMKDKSYFEIEELYNSRINNYCSNSDLILCSNSEIEKIADLILKEYKLVVNE